MTIDNTSPREITELINLKTYQDMTDEEIEIIINYKVDVELRRRLSVGKEASIILEMEQLIAQNKESCDRAMSMLESTLRERPILHSVGGDNE